MTDDLFQYKECGLEDVWLVNGYTDEDTPYGKGIAIHDVDGLHCCIANMLVYKPEPLTGAEFRFLRHELDLSQKLIGELFGVSERRVRTWETTDVKKHIKEPYNRLLRLIYSENENPTTTFRGLVDRLKNIDKVWHGVPHLHSTAEGWRETA